MTDHAIGTKPFWAKCPTCGHCWPAAYFPLRLDVCGRLLKAARCPKGCKSPVMIAKQDDGVLQEESAA